MANTKTTAHTDINYGDSAVDGLIGGAISGVLMAILLIIAGLVGDDTIGSTMGHFAPPGNDSPLVGTIAHLAVSAIYGVIFSLVLSAANRVRPGIRRWSWLLGSAFGLILWLAAEVVILPAVDSPLKLISPLSFALAHLVYGLALGLIIGRTHQ